MAEKIGLFDLSGFLGSQGFALAGVDEKGTYLVKDQAGNVSALDVNEAVKSAGLDPKTVDIEFNTPDKPIEDSSPVGMKDRLALQAGNAKGGLEYLRQRYEDASYHPEKGLLVKHKSAWHVADVDTDPWELSKELGKDIIEGSARIAPSILGQTGGAAAGAWAGAKAGAALAAPLAIVPGIGAAVVGGGAAVGGVIGGVLGSGIGSGIAEFARTSLGRLLGTYKATPEEELADIGFETLIGMGGQTLAIGVRPSLKMLSQVSRNIRGKASEASIETAAKVLGKTTNTGELATETLLRQSDDVAKEIGAAKRYGSPSAMQSGLTTEQVKLGEEMLERVAEEVPNRYGRELATLVKEASKKPDFVVNVQNLISSAKGELETLGYGKFVKGKLVPFTPDEVAARLQQNLPVEALEKETFRRVQSIVNALDNFSAVKEVRGDVAANVLTKINKSINSIQRDLLKGQTPASVERAVTQVSAGFRNALGETFEKAGLSNEYTSLQQVYVKYGESLKEARKMLKDPSGAEKFVNALLAKPGKGEAKKTMGSMWQELLGDSGSNYINRLQVKEAAKQYSRWAPQMGLLQTAGVGGAALNAGSILANPVGALGTAAMVAPVASPRIAAALIHKTNSAVKHASNLKDFIVNLPPAKRLQLLADSKATDELFRAALTAYGQESVYKNELLNQAGIQQ